MSNNLPMLYGRSSTGKIKTWEIGTEGAEVVMLYGQAGGKIQEKRTTSVGKNIGRSNETSPSAQASLEAASKWRKQIDSDYRENIEDIPQSTLPNLAHKYQERFAAIIWPCDIITKLDGVRCSIFYVGDEIVFQSRGGKHYPVIQEIKEELDMIFFCTDYDKEVLVVDCELYCHGMFLEDITSAVKKHNKDTPKIECWVFDVINKQFPEKTWKYRYSIYHSWIQHHREDLNRVYDCIADRCDNEGQMLKLHDSVVKRGYEGIILRNLNGVNSFGNRTTDFIKYKERFDAEYRVVGWEVDKNLCLVPVCEIMTDKGMKTFKAPLIGTREWTQDLVVVFETFGSVPPNLEWLTCEFEKLSKYGIPTKVKGKSFREVVDGEVQT